MGPGANCEIVFATSDPPGPSGIEVQNATGGALSVTVEGGGLVGTGANLDAEECNVWAYPAGTYEVRLQRCDEAFPGDNSCTSLLGSEVIRSIIVQGDSRTALRVDGSFFR